MNAPNAEVEEEHKPKQESNISKEKSKLIILNPTMKEISKLENDSSINDDDVPDVLGEFKKNNEENTDRKIEIDKEEDEIFINHIHRMSMRKLEIGKMRSKLISNSVNKDKYVDEVSIDKERALKMADNIFKRRLKHINKNKIIELESRKNNSDIIQFSPQPFIKRLIGRIDTESNSFSEKINKKKEEIIGSNNDYKNNVTKTEHNIESYTSNNNNKDKKDQKNNKIEVKTNLNTLSKNNINSRSYTNIRENKVETSKGNRNNNQNMKRPNEKKNININININNNKNDKSKGIAYNDIKEYRYNRNNHLPNSQTNSLKNIAKVNNTSNTSPNVVISSSINSGNTSRKNATNITKINSPNISTSNSPKANNNISINHRSNNMTSISSKSNNNPTSNSPRSNNIKSNSNVNVNSGPNNTRKNKGNNEAKIIPISLPLNKINKQLNNDNLLQRANKTSRGYNRSPLSKPLEIEIINSNKKSPNKEGVTVTQKVAITAANEPRRRNANKQANTKDTKKFPQKTEMGNRPNTSRGNERNKIDIKHQVARTSRGNEKDKIEIKKRGINTSRGNEKNKVEIKNQGAKTSRGNERNKIEIKIQVPSNRRGNNQIEKKSPVKVENKKIVTTTTSNRRGQK